MPKHGHDLEVDGSVVRPIDGFPSLARFIASDHDRTSLVFKRFDELAALNLLYLQSELADLQAQRATHDAKALNGDLQSRLCALEGAMHWEKFRNDATIPGSKAEERIQLVMKIRRLMKEYSKIANSSSLQKSADWDEEKRFCSKAP